jgi:Tol biopolymer transport system component
LYLRDLKTGTETALTTDQFDNQMPVFSPNGKILAFVAAKNGGNYRIYLMPFINESQSKPSE